ncbi:MAG: hypothetical protein WKF71_10505 [Pyrinomonadaceae bacterium]
MPYHETLTIFWMRIICNFVHFRNNASFVEVCNKLIEELDKDLPLKFYSCELLFQIKREPNLSSLICGIFDGELAAATSAAKGSDGGTSP